MSFYNKYLKYKQKYLLLKGGETNNEKEEEKKEEEKKAECQIDGIIKIYNYLYKSVLFSELIKTGILKLNTRFFDFLSKHDLTLQAYFKSDEHNSILQMAKTLLYDYITILYNNKELNDKILEKKQLEEKILEKKQLEEKILELKKRILNDKISNNEISKKDLLLDSLIVPLLKKDPLKDSLIKKEINLDNIKIIESLINNMKLFCESYILFEHYDVNNLQSFIINNLKIPINKIKAYDFIMSKHIFQMLRSYIDKINFDSTDNNDEIEKNKLSNAEIKDLADRELAYTQIKYKDVEKREAASAEATQKYIEYIDRYIIIFNIIKKYSCIQS